MFRRLGAKATNDPVRAPEWNRDVVNNLNALGRDMPTGKAFNSTAITIAYDTWTQLEFDSNLGMTSGWLHSKSADAGALNIPVTGIYLVGCDFEFDEDPTGLFTYEVLIANDVAGGTINDVIAHRKFHPADAGNPKFSVSNIVRLNSGSRLVAWVYHNATAVTFVSYTGTTVPALYATLLAQIGDG